MFHQLLLLGEPGGSWVAPLSTCEEEGWSKGSMEGLESDPKVGEGISVTSVVGGSAHVHVCKPVSAYFISMYVYLCLCVYLCLQD